MKCRKIGSILLAFVVTLTLMSTTVSAEGSAATSELTTNGNGGKTDVGIWYMTYNNATMWSNNFGSGNPIMYRALVSRNPDTYGIADSSDVDEIDMHLEMIAEAKIDFIVFDLTNGGLTDKMKYGTGNEWIVENAKLTCERIALWNSTHEWKIKYAVAVGTYEAIRDGMPIGYIAELQAEAVYKDFFENEEYGGEHYYQLDGKPLLILFDWTQIATEELEYYSGERTYADEFTVRSAAIGEVGTYGWYTGYGSPIVHDEVELVCPGWGHASGDSKIPRENGAYYQRGWDVILNNKLPRIVMISAFNDFNEKLAVMPADTSECNNNIEEQWRDETGELNNTMYWNMTVEGIRQVRIMNGELTVDSNKAATWMYIVPIAITVIGVMIAFVSVIIIVIKLKRNEKVDTEQKERVCGR